MAMVENFARRREENSQCLSRDMVRKASRPSIRSHEMRLSGSLVPGRGEEMEEGGVRRTVKKTSLCFSIVWYTLLDRSSPPTTALAFLLDLLRVLVFLLPLFLLSAFLGARPY